MKKHLKRFMIYILCVFIIFMNLIHSDLKVHAEVNTFSVESVTIDGITLNAYVYSDSSLLPDTKQVYWVQNGYVQHEVFSKALVVMLNKKFGLAIKETYLVSLLSWLQTNIFTSAHIISNFFTGGVSIVWNGSAAVGIALNDLTGYSLTGELSSNDSVTIPSTQVNIIYDEVNYYMESVDPVTPDFINIPTQDYATARSQVQLTSNRRYGYNETINNAQLSGRPYFCYGLSNSWGQFYDGTGNRFSKCVDNTDLIYVTTLTDNFNSIVSIFNLTETNNTVDKLAMLNSYGNTELYCYGYESENWTKKQFVHTRINQDDGFEGSFTEMVTNDNTLVLSTSNHGMPLHDGSYITVYKNVNTPNAIINNTYQKNVYKSTTYNNYDRTTNNEFNITVPEMQSSNQTNQNIYNQSTTTTNQNISNNNYEYDNSVNDNSVTTIINNYYPSDNGGGDNGGGGDDNGGDDDDDDTIWKALLKAIGDFLKKIGELIATVLTGIISILTSVLDAIASITTSFSAITDFLGAVFGFLPSELVAVITLGVTLGILISLIKMFGK